MHHFVFVFEGNLLTPLPVSLSISECLNSSTHERVASQGARDSVRKSTEFMMKLSQPGKYMFANSSNKPRSDALTAT